MRIGMYFVSRDGVVTNTKSGRVLKSQINSSGYPCVTLRVDGVKKMYSIHRLVAMGYVSGFRDGLVVNHIDGDKMNYSPSNLEWVTSSQNSIHAYKNGLNSRSGENNGRHKLTKHQVSEIRWLHEVGVSKKELADVYDVGLKSIYDILSLRTWKEVM